MDIYEFAKMLDGREYGEEITEEEEKQAKERGFVVVFGYSDDNAEFRGAIDEEVGCWEGGEVFLDKDGIIEDCNCRYGRAARENAKVIEAVWCREGERGFAWSYDAEIPHATFEIYEGKDPYCQGIVFDVKEL